MTDEKRFASRRDILTSAGHLGIGRFLAPALGIAALSSPAAATPAPHTNVSEDETEATAEKVVDALEGVYGVHHGQRRNHTKGGGRAWHFRWQPGSGNLLTLGVVLW